MLANQNRHFPGHDHGLGFELNQPHYMGRLAGPHTCGHTGFTGTSVVIDIDRQTFLILLTNRVHPSRDWGGINPARSMMADAVVDAFDVPPAAESIRPDPSRQSFSTAFLDGGWRRSGSEL
jgi:CubicO group peptidase (beta-lactamase class C family)